MKQIAVFDFDGTMIKDDSMILFFKKYFNFSFKNTKKLLILFIQLFKFYLKIYTRKQFKEIFINIIIDSSKTKNLKKIGREFSGFILKLIFKGAIDEVKRLASIGYETVLLSASPDFYLNGIKEAIGFDSLICTTTDVIDGSVAITGYNCFGKNKIKKLKEEYPDSQVDWKNSYCFTDGPSDRQLLKLFGNAFVVNNKRLKKKNPCFGFIAWD